MVTSIGLLKPHRIHWELCWTIKQSESVIGKNFVNSPSNESHIHLMTCMDNRSHRTKDTCISMVVSMNVQVTSTLEHFLFFTYLDAPITLYLSFLIFSSSTMNVVNTFLLSCVILFFLLFKFQKIETKYYMNCHIAYYKL